MSHSAGKASVVIGTPAAPSADQPLAPSPPNDDALRVLVAYATRGGTTLEISGEVGRVLEAAGMRVELAPAADIEDLAAYDVVVLGSALYFQRLMPDALEFLRRHRHALGHVPFALFSVGAEMRKGTPKARESAQRWVDGSLATVGHADPFAVAHFAGAVELRRLGFWWRLLVIATFGERGDWRDISSVREWTRSLIPLLTRSR
jgi:menaquinone-dependent protoporphyrinogen oxidase